VSEFGISDDGSDEFIIKSAGERDLEESRARETKSFSQMLVFTALHYHADEVGAYARRFRLADAAAFAAKAGLEIHHLCQRAAMQSSHPYGDEPAV
jgi:hypothetical protein